MNPPQPYSIKTTAVVVTTAMLTFISYWRAAAIVLCDLSSSAYYACGIAEHMIGKAAPWFVLAIMFFSLPVRMIFMESSAMFVRGGVYKVAKAAIGGTLAKVAVSALLFDFILTGPISAVSAAQYLVGFYNQSVSMLGYPSWYVPTNQFVVLIAICIIGYFWRQNILGIPESSEKALRIMQLTTVMTLLLLGWSIVTLLMHPAPLPPMIPHLNDAAFGWLKDFDWARSIGAVGVIIALGHSLLAMSGEETLAQVYREIAAPKVANFRKAGTIIWIYSLVLTGVISLFAVMIVPDQVRPDYHENLLSGLAMYLVGPPAVKLALQAFVVLVGVVLLSGAVNTAMVGANADLNRLAEDGVLPMILRKLHRRYGTTARMLHIFAVLQIGIVFASRGDIIILGEAYAFGVLWSMVFIALSVLVLRWRDRGPREFCVPLNCTIGRVHLPIGVAATFFVLLLLALANFFTKVTATQFGLCFTVGCFLLLSISERVQRKRYGQAAPLERVNLAFQETATAQGIGLTHKHRVLVAARDPDNLSHLRRVLERMDPKRSDVVVMTVRRTMIPPGAAEDLPVDEQVFVTNVVALAERYGMHVTPLIIPANDPIYATVKAAFDLGANEIVIGKSGRTNPEVQLEKLAMAWGFVAAERPRRITLRVAWPQKEIKFDVG
ncbi:MAG: APC family permease [Deltaproteobacteria bacterium]|nr:APC family permease [Deltaproteobacteria bacterium]